MEGGVLVADREIPQWKRDLILRIKNKYKWPLNEQQQLLAGTSRNLSDKLDRDEQEPNLTFSNAAAVPVVSSSGCDKLNCNVNSLPLKSSKMVQECTVDYDRYNQYNSNNNILENGSDKSDDSGSSEELHYGPGIVNKLKNRYLSLTLRESNAKPRPSILCMRKATSLENLLEDEVPNKLPASTRYKGNNVNKNIANKYYNATRGSDLKRARSVEAISRIDDQPKEYQAATLNETRLKHQSLHEDMLIIPEGNDKLLEKICDSQTAEITTENKISSNTVNHRLNRPKRIAPVMSEKEKPPIDVVKQTKRLFEGKPDQRTKVPHQTGEVAAKVATYKSIIGQTKCSKKPIIKQKPVVHPEERKTPTSPTKPGKLHLKLGDGWINKENSVSNTSPGAVVSLIPDVSRIINTNNIETSFHHHNNQSNISSNLSETPDLILHSSPVKSASSPTFRILATDNFLKAEITHSNSDNHKNEYNCEDDKKLSTRIKLSSPTKDEQDGFKIEARNKVKPNGSASPPYNISPLHIPCSNLPAIDNESRNNNKTKFSPDKHAFSKTNVKTEKNSQLSPASPTKPITIQHNLSPQEIEKNKINTAKTLEQSYIKNIPNVAKTVEEVKKVEVPKLTSKPKESRDQNSIVFKFTDRKDVPDHVYNDGKIRTGKIEKPKVGEGGITFLPGVSLDESLVDDDDDDDEEWKTSLKSPPSPCNIEFVNDNVIFEGRSSLSQKSKKPKEMKIQFETIPDVYEYPSEASLLDDFSSPPLETSSGHTVPTLSGSTLSNYIPKSGSKEDFQLGITRSSIPASPAVNENFQNEETLEDLDEPVLFSSGTNSDILF